VPQFLYRLRALPADYLLKGLLVLFIFSRVFIWIFRPIEFTEIIYSYMPYAHLWASGTKPYLEQWYEYPPATIPLFYLPHLVDQSTFGTPWHLNYNQAYRGSILLIDVAVFVLIWKILQKTKITFSQRALSIFYFIATTAKAHHFIYDTVDWVFAATILLSCTAPLILDRRLKEFGVWLGYWLGVATKLVNGPLGIIYAFLEPKRWKKTFFWIILTAGLVWGLPLLLYRSSLQVMFVYHAQRGLQIDSVGAVIARVADRFTHSETIVELYKNYEITGPISDNILRIVEKAFPISIGFFIFFAWYLIAKTPIKKKNFLRIHLTLGYVIVFMIFGKVLSAPFLLWHIPLVTIYPFQQIKTQKWWQFTSFLFILLCMTPLPFLEWGVIHLPTWIHVAKTLILIGWLSWWIKQSQQLIQIKPKKIK